MDEEPQKTQQPKARGLITLAVIAILVVLLFLIGQHTIESTKEEPTISKLNEYLADGKVEKIKISGEELILSLREEGKKVTIPVPKEYLSSEKLDWLMKKSEANPSPPKVIFEPTGGFWSSLFFSLILPVLLLAFIWIILVRSFRSPGAGGSILSFGRAKARLAPKEKMRVTFEDVAGIEEAKEEMQEVVEFLKHPSKFKKMGARIPRGVLLVGAPGTGKTLLAKAVAGEAGVRFFSISGSDFVEMFVGVGASRVRDLFQRAKESAPSIIFLDEVDAIGRKRGVGIPGGGQDERESTLNAILVEMDGFETDEGIIIIAATNRPDMLDPALLRPGRFDKVIVVDLPDVKGREGILKVHAKKVRLASDVDLGVIARLTPMFSGAELEALINEAALIAVARNKEFVDMECLEEARDKVKWGTQKKSRVMEEEDKRIIAYHESGHALAAYYLPDADKLHKVTIIPRGMTGGATMLQPKKELLNLRKKRLLSDIMLMLAGRVAEEMFCNDITTGAQNDIQRATEIARMMVSEWGMSEELGPIRYGIVNQSLFLGSDFLGKREFSEETAKKIDDEVHKIIKKCYEEAKQLLNEHKSEVELVAQGLIRYEALSFEEVKTLIETKDLNSLITQRSQKKGGEKKNDKREGKNGESSQHKADSVQ
jgi:cell division protease FtsH